MFGTRSRWVRLAKQIRNSQQKRISNPSNKQQRKPYCNNGESSSSGDSGSNKKKKGGIVWRTQFNRRYDPQVYEDLKNLDVMKATKIVLTHPPKIIKVGVDYFVVHLLFNCSPILAVLLVVMYARREMRKLEEQRELKKKEERDKDVKEIAAEIQERSEPDIVEVRERLETLEKALEEIVIETKKILSGEKSKSVAKNKETENPKTRSDSSHVAVANNQEKEDHKPISDSSHAAVANNQEREDPKTRSDNSHAAAGNPPTAQKAKTGSDK